MPLTATVQIQDLALIRVFAMQAKGRSSAPKRNLRQVALPGRLGSYVVMSESPGGREFTIEGSIFAHSLLLTDREASEHAFKDLAFGQPATIRLDDGQNAPLEINGLCTALEIEQYGPTLLAIASNFSLSLLCDDPLWRDVYAITVGLDGTLRELPQGTAPSAPKFRIMGASTPVVDPVITVRAISGEVVNTLEFDISLSDDDYIEHDCLDGVTRKTIDGVTTVDASILVDGDPLFPLDPKHGSRFLDSWVMAALSASSGTPTGEVEYLRRWL